MVKIKLHGDMGKTLGEEWNLNVKSVGEAIRAIEMNTKKLYKYIMSQGEFGGKYQVLINEEPFIPSPDLGLENPETIRESELMIRNKNLRSIDIVPVLEGSDSKILSIVLVVIGVVLIATGVGAPGGLAAIGLSSTSVIVAGIGLVAAGVFALLSQPPKFEDFREIETGGKTSYLFSGPSNVVGEGGPVPLGYGHLLIGSQAISAAYAILQINAEDTSQILRNVNPVVPIYYP